jgi:hypothetical protein
MEMKQVNLLLAHDQRSLAFFDGVASDGVDVVKRMLMNSNEAVTEMENVVPGGSNEAFY